MPYTVEDKTFIWTTDEGTEVKLPLRLKLKVLRALAHEDLDNVSTMFAMIDAIAPGQQDVLDEQDVKDFTEMFAAWQQVYNDEAGATLGESSR